VIVIACSTGIRSTASLDAACRLVAELGFAYVDPLAIEQWHIKPSLLIEDPQRQASAARRILDAHRLDAVALNLGFLHSFTTCSPAEHEINLQVVRNACALAGTLGTAVITVGTGSVGVGERSRIVDRVARRLSAVVEIAAQADMVIALETHSGSIAVDPTATQELLSRCPGLKLTYDPSHYIAEQIPIEHTLGLLEHAAHVHLRNARVGSFQETMAKGLLDMPWMIDQILSAGYEGAIAIEYIEDCGALQEGYDTVDQVLALVGLLQSAGLPLKTGA
jgi:sugar phosphate isomerase/epimerase